MRNIIMVYGRLLASIAMGKHDTSDHADAPQHGSKTNSVPEWKGDAIHKMSKIGTKFGSTPNNELTEAEIQMLGEEIGKIEERAERGDYLAAATQLNSFWDDWTEAAVEAQIKANSKNKNVCEQYGSRLNQAKQYGLLGEGICEVLGNLNKQRHKPGHQTWGDVDSSDSEFQNTFAKALVLTKRHYKHLEQEHT